MKSNDIPLEPQAEGKENRSTEAQSDSGTKKDANEFSHLRLFWYHWRVCYKIQNHVGWTF